MRRKVRAVFIALALAATSVRAQSTPVDTAPVVRGQVLHRNMSAGRSATFALRVDSGEFVRVIVETRGFHADFTVISPAGERLLSIEGMVDERQIVPVEARSTGTYRLVVASSGPVVGDGRYTVEASSVTRSALAAEADSIRGWLQGHSVGLKRVLPNAPYDDLLPLIHALRGVRVIGLGESTHGTHEYRVMAHRLFAFLATRMNVRVFAIESSYPSVLAINKYVLSGVGDPAEALAGQGYWITNTEEVLDLIRWMRRFNEKLPEARKLHFMGIDMVHTRLAVEALTEYLRKFGPYKLLELERVASLDRSWRGLELPTNPHRRIALRGAALCIPSMSYSGSWECTKRPWYVSEAARRLIPRVGTRESSRSGLMRWEMNHRRQEHGMPTWRTISFAISMRWVRTRGR